MSNTLIAQRKCTIPHLTMKNMTCIVTVLCIQLEAFASDLGDDQSRYLFIIALKIYDRSNLQSYRPNTEND